MQTQMLTTLEQVKNDFRKLTAKHQETLLENGRLKASTLTGEASKEDKVKTMLKQSMFKNLELKKTIAQHEEQMGENIDLKKLVGSLREENATLKKGVGLYAKLEEEGKLRVEIAVLKKRLANLPAASDGSELQHKISELSGAEVPRQAVNELIRQFRLAGEVLDNDGIPALSDCKVFGMWKIAHQEYEEALAHAMGGGGRSNDSDGDHTQDSGESAKEESMEDESFQQWERENA